MESFLIISATLHQNPHHPIDGLLEIDLTNDGDLLLESFNLVISSTNRLDPLSEESADEFTLVKKKIQKIQPSESMIFRMPIDLNNQLSKKVVLISVQANKRIYRNFSLSTEVLL